MADDRSRGIGEGKDGHREGRQSVNEAPPTANECEHHGERTDDDGHAGRASPDER